MDIHAQSAKRLQGNTGERRPVTSTPNAHNAASRSELFGSDIPSIIHDGLDEGDLSSLEEGRILTVRCIDMYLARIKDIWLPRRKEGADYELRCPAEVLDPPGEITSISVRTNWTFLLLLQNGYWRLVAIYWEPDDQQHCHSGSVFIYYDPYRTTRPHTARAEQSRIFARVEAAIEQPDRKPSKLVEVTVPRQPSRGSAERNESGLLVLHYLENFYLYRRGVHLNGGKGLASFPPDGIRLHRQKLRQFVTPDLDTTVLEEQPRGRDVAERQAKASAGRKGYPCVIGCEWSTDRMSHLLDHYMHHHAGVRYKCPHCPGLNFNRRDRLSGHVRRTHMDDSSCEDGSIPERVQEELRALQKEIVADVFTWVDENGPTIQGYTLSEQIDLCEWLEGYRV